ncbi:hypothetical protein HDU85_006281 [Gaertneriomyces sp. JEL0708]|nr:hypothetical protein HDU85_006281 [Gaertneriomyces sp. JEL0708]
MPKTVTVPFTREEKRNIIFYVVGIMCYKFALESYTGTISSLALDRFPDGQVFFYKGFLDERPCRCHFRIRPISSLGMIIEGVTGGKPPRGDQKAIVGAWDARIIIPIFVCAGFSHGTVELIRRVIPRDIVGGDVVKLKRMDATVHIFYEVAGTSGAFFSAWIQLTLGKAFAPVVTPFLFAIAAVAWSGIRVKMEETREKALETIDASESVNGFRAVGDAFVSFGFSIYKGGQIIFSDRKFAWLILGYSLPLFLHRYLEQGLAQNFAKLILKEPAYGQIMVGGSNFGELIGAAFVLAFTTLIKTPLPWLRLDALTLTIGWVLWKADPSQVGALTMAWILAAVFVGVSAGWAAGDVSLTAFIQSNLSRHRNNDARVSSLGAVMGFLYVTYIVIFAIMNPVLGRWLDRLHTTRGVEGDREYFFWVGGVMFTVCGAVIMAATFVPKGSFAFNPDLDAEYDSEVDEEEIEVKDFKDPKNLTEELFVG